MDRLRGGIAGSAPAGPADGAPTGLRRLGLPGLLFALALAACAAPGDRPAPDATYIRWVSVEVPVNESVLLRWPRRRMPLRVHLPPPPEGLFDDPEAIADSVRDGILDWAGVAGPDVPAFVFVDEIGDADIPVTWAREADGDWYIAYCAYDIDPFTRRFGVSGIVVTARWGNGHVADLHDVYRVMLHEVGHALGLAGHSPDPADIMYPSATGSTAEALSDRDRATLALLYARPIGSRIAPAIGSR